MKLAKIIGTLVATQKIESIKDAKILMIQPLDHHLNAAGDPIAAIDSIQAGYGDLVYYTIGKEAALALPNDFAPVEAVVTGIVDQVNVESKEIKDKEKIFGEDK